MRILHVIHSHCSGSLERLVVNLTRQLNKRGVESQIAFLKEENAVFPREKADGIKSYQLDCGYAPGSVSQVIGIIRQEKIDIVHTHDLQSIYWGLAAKLSLRPSIHTQHVRTYKKVSNWIYNLNKFIVCASEDIKKDLLTYNSLPKQKIQIVYNGIDLEAVDREIDAQKRQALRRQWGFDDKAFVMGTIGRLIKEEDQATIIKALRKMVSRELDARLLIAGEGPLKEELEKIASEYQVNDRLKFVAFNGNAGAILNGIDCLILANFHEGRPFTLLEAMAARKPVIATAIGANKEVIEERKNGYLVPCGFPERIHSAVMRLTAIESLAAEIGAAGRKRVEENFTLEQMARGYSELYSQVK